MTSAAADALRYHGMGRRGIRVERTNCFLLIGLNLDQPRAIANRTSWNIATSGIVTLSTRPAICKAASTCTGKMSSTVQIRRNTMTRNGADFQSEKYMPTTYAVVADASNTIQGSQAATIFLPFTDQVMSLSEENMEKLPNSKAVY